MSLSSVTKEVDFKNSIKKYFLDSLETIEQLKIFFESLFEVPVDSSGKKLKSWVVVSFGYRNLGNVSEQQVSLDLYTTEDNEADDLAELVDAVMNYLIDEDSINGLKTIPYYDSSWAVVGGIIPFIQPAFGRMESEDGVQYKSINLLCKWGGK